LNQNRKDFLTTSEKKQPSGNVRRLSWSPFQWGTLRTLSPASVNLNYCL